MNIWKEFIRGSGITFIIQVLGVACAFFSQIALVRWLSTEGFGIYSYVVTVISLVTVFAQMGLFIAVVRFISAAKIQESWSKLYGIIVISRRLVILNSFFLVVVGGLFIWALSSRIDDLLETALIFGLLLLPLQVLGTLQHRILHGLKEITAFQIAEELIIPLAMIVGALLLANSGVASPVYAVILRLAAALIMVSFGIWWLRRSLPEEARGVKPEYNLREILRVALPIFAASPMQTILNKTDIILLGYFTTMSDVAVYMVAQRISLQVPLGLVAASVIAAPLISESFARKDNVRLQTAAFLTACIATIFTIGFIVFLMLFEEWVLNLFGPDYQIASLPMWILVSGQFINSITGSVIPLLTMTEYQKHFFYVVMTSALFNIAANIILIPQFGIIGASAATLMSTVIWNVWLCVIVIIRLKINPTVFSKSMLSKAISMLWKQYNIVFSPGIYHDNKLK